MKKQVEEGAGTRARRVANAQIRGLGEQGSQTQLEPEQNGGVTLPSLSDLGPLRSPLCPPPRPQSRGSKGGSVPGDTGFPLASSPGSGPAFRSQVRTRRAAARTHYTQAEELRAP